MSDDQAAFVPAYREPEESRDYLVNEPVPGYTGGPPGAPHFRPLPVDIVMEKDVAVTRRDGVTVYVDVLRPPGDKKLAVLTAWSPMASGNASQYVDLLSLLRLDLSKLSGREKFEAPDPAFWCATAKVDRLPTRHIPDHAHGRHPERPARPAA